MADEWATDPDFECKVDQLGARHGGGTASVANPFLGDVLKSQQAPAPAPAPPKANPIRRANSFDRFGGGGVRCTVCYKMVYAAEQRVVGKETFHKDCFRCAKEGCSKLLQQDYCLESSTGKYYCKPQWVREDRTRGLQASASPPSPH